MAPMLTKEDLMRSLQGQAKVVMVILTREFLEYISAEGTSGQKLHFILSCYHCYQLLVFDCRVVAVNHYHSVLYKSTYCIFFSGCF